jgi:hypothetical protein
VLGAPWTLSVSLTGIDWAGRGEAQDAAIKASVPAVAGTKLYRMLFIGRLKTCQGFFCQT